MLFDTITLFRKKHNPEWQSQTLYTAAVICSSINSTFPIWKITACLRLSWPVASPSGYVLNYSQLKPKEETGRTCIVRWLTLFNWMFERIHLPSRHTETLSIGIMLLKLLCAHATLCAKSHNNGPHPQPHVQNISAFLHSWSDKQNQYNKSTAVKP